jgi:hypothetical protein
VLLLAHLLLLLAAVLWTAATRFGTELPPPPAIEPGKRFLIENIAGLLHTGGHSGHAAQRWVRDRLRESAQALHAPPGLDEAGIRAFVLQAAARRTGGARLPLLLEAAARRAADHADGARLTASLREIHETLAETVHGSN